MGISSFVLHIIAMFLMLCDHLWGTILGNWEWLGYLGRLAFPIFAYLFVEGFHHTKNRKKYAQRLLLFAIISEIPFNLLTAHHFIYPFHQNVLWTFLLGMGVLTLYEKTKRFKPLIRLLLFSLITLGGYMVGFIGFVDYYGYGLLMIVLFYFTRMKGKETIPQKIGLCFIQLVGMYWINCEMMMGMMIPITIFNQSIFVYKQSFALLSLLILWFYNGKQGPYNKTIKYSYYWFYPVHLLILGLWITYL